MKTFKNLAPKVSEWSHLLGAYKKALRGSGHTKESRYFQFYLEQQLLALQEEIRSQSYQPSPFRYFQIFEPKKRLISVAPFRDRVVHHAVIMMLDPLLDPTFIYHSYATRVNKGTHAAIAQAQSFVRSFPFFYKADISKYFEHIDQHVLLAMLGRKIGDRIFLSLIEKIIRNGGLKGKGLPIGNLTSQFFANVYLNSFDHFIKEKLNIKGYLRYMDDFVIFGKDRKKLKADRKHIEAYLKEKLFLSIKPSASYFSSSHLGLSFLGARIFPSLIRIKPANKQRLVRRLKTQKRKHEEGKISLQDYLMTLNSYWAHLCTFDSLPLRRRLIQELGLQTHRLEPGAPWG